MSDLPSAALGVLAALATADASAADASVLHSLDAAADAVPDASAAAAASCCLLSTLPEDVYNADRDAAGRLDSTPLRLCVQLSAAARKAFDAEVRARTGDSAARAAFAALVHVDIVLADGTCPMVYWDGDMTPAQAPSADFGELVRDTLVLYLRRELPLSSSHGGSPMRLGIRVGSEVLLSAPFTVHSKRSKTVTKVKRARPVAAPSAHRLQLLRDIYTTTAATRPTKMHKV